MEGYGPNSPILGAVCLAPLKRNMWSKFQSRNKEWNVPWDYFQPCWLGGETENKCLLWSCFCVRASMQCCWWQSSREPVFTLCDGDVHEIQYVVFVVAMWEPVCSVCGGDVRVSILCLWWRFAVWEPVYSVCGGDVGVWEPVYGVCVGDVRASTYTVFVVVMFLYGKSIEWRSWRYSCGRDGSHWVFYGYCYVTSRKKRDSFMDRGRVSWPQLLAALRSVFLATCAKITQFTVISLYAVPLRRAEEVDIFNTIRSK
jgi:hypothetical protein